jgi:hypothetical protein
MKKLAMNSAELFYSLILVWSFKVLITLEDVSNVSFTPFSIDGAKSLKSFTSIYTFGFVFFAGSEKKGAHVVSKSVRERNPNQPAWLDSVSRS